MPAHSYSSIVGPEKHLQQHLLGTNTIWYITFSGQKQAARACFFDTLMLRFKWLICALFCFYTGTPLALSWPGWSILTWSSQHTHSGRDMRQSTKKGGCQNCISFVKRKKVQAPFLAGTVSPQPPTPQELQMPSATTPGKHGLLVFMAEGGTHNPWLDSWGPLSNRVFLKVLTPCSHPGP